MIIYKDIISGDEIASDSYTIKEAAGGMLYEVECKRTTKGAENFELEGANPSAEEPSEDPAVDTTQITVVELVDKNHFVELGSDMKPSKAEFKSIVKKYVRRVNEALVSNGASEETIKEFQAGAPAAMKHIVSNYDEYDVCMGPKLNSDAMYILINYRKDGITPFATIWKHGLIEEKC